MISQSQRCMFESSMSVTYLMANTSKVTHNGLHFLPRALSAVAESSRLQQVCQQQEIWSSGRLENVKLMQMEDSERHKNA